MLRTDKNESIVVSALRARANFGKLLDKEEALDWLDENGRIVCVIGMPGGDAPVSAPQAFSPG